MKILLVEDEIRLQQIIKESLNKEKHLVELCSTYEEAEEKVQLYPYDCILLDITLPGGSGLDILRLIKKENIQAMIIIISAKNSIDDKIEGLDLGADDYLAKPFHLSELHARIRSVTRRNLADGKNLISLGNTTINPSDLSVQIDQKVVELNRKEYDLLFFFLTRPNHLVEKTVLAESVWGDHIDQVDNFDFLYAQIKNLRKKLKDNKATIELKAVYGFGYKMVEK